MPFKTLRLIKPLLSAIQSEGYASPTEIQQQAIPHALEGRDLLGCAQTGTGKTAAFALPILQRLYENTKPAASSARGRGGKRAPKPIRALILTPTRELAAQIGESFQTYGQHTKLNHTVIFGGVKQQRQTQALRRGVDILVATPGRLLDLMNQGIVCLSNVEVFVLDEADRMLDMGFLPDMRRVIEKLPEYRQTLLFSATMPGKIRALAEKILREPVQVKVAAKSPAADTVKQSLYFIAPQGKQALLEKLLEDAEIKRALVFTRTKHGADKVVRRLGRASIVAQAIHSNKSQNARLAALKSFKRGDTRVLVASDIAARGLDVDDISHVFNYDLPNEAETYIHRIGRTGRAGALGRAISFCCDDQRDFLKDIERLLGKAIPVLSHSIKVQQAPKPPQKGASSATPRTKKPASPEQQRSEFWRSRQKRGSSPSAASKPRNGRSRRGRG